VGNAATSALVQRHRECIASAPQESAVSVQRSPTGSSGFEDDPLSAGGFGPNDATIRVKPGPVQSTLTRPRLHDKEGSTFREKMDDSGQPRLYDASTDDPGAWAQGFLTWAGFDWTQDPLGDIGKVKYVLRHIDANMYDVPQLKQIVVGEALAEGLVLDPSIAEATAAALARPATSTSKKDNSTQLVVSWTFVPKQISTPVTGGPTTASNPIQQIQGQYTWKFHEDDDPGIELSAMGQAQLTLDPQTKSVIHQDMVGGQAAAVTNFFTKFVQLQAVGQVLGGATFVIGNPIEHKVIFPRSLSAQPTGQVALGVQSVFTIPSTNEHLQVVLQAQGALTDTGGLVTFDRSTGIGIQIAF
jgi:hypothetical protein